MPITATLAMVAAAAMAGVPLLNGFLSKEMFLAEALETHSGTVLDRSEEHTSELQSLMRISYAVFCLKKKNKLTYKNTKSPNTTNITSCHTNSSLTLMSYTNIRLK